MTRDQKTTLLIRYDRLIQKLYERADYERRLTVLYLNGDQIADAKQAAQRATRAEKIAQRAIGNRANLRNRQHIPA